MSAWLNLTPAEFEQFGYELLRLNGFKNLQWHGASGSDRGRDITGTKVDRPLPGVELQKRWVAQCKHYPKAKLSKPAIQSWLAACREHRPDNALLIVSRSLSSATKDWLEAIRSEYPFEIHLWEESHLRGQYFQHGGKLRKLFPDLPKARSRVWVYEQNQAERVVVCHGYEDVGFITWNYDTTKESMEAVRAFIEFIKANDFRFDINTT